MRPQAELNLLSLKNNVPVSATAELTRRCVYSCRHCYLPETRGRAKAQPEKELRAAEWGRVFAGLRDLGTISLVLTGGEPFLRRDLPEICSLAAEHDLDASVYTSLYAADAEILENLRKAGLKKLEVSLYGREKTYESVTGKKGSFARVVSNLKTARRKGFKIKIKTPLLRLNGRELGWLNSFCKKNGFNLAVDPQLAPANDGRKAAAALRPGRGGLEELFKKPWFKPRKNADSLPADDLPVCGAGRNVISIDPYGNVYPCLQLLLKAGNARKQRLSAIWKKSAALARVRKALSRPPAKCLGCSLLASCARCPGLSLLHAKSLSYPYRDACVLADLAGKMLQ